MYPVEIKIILRISFFLPLFSYFVHLAEDFSDNEELFAKDMTKWNSNDLMDKIETIEVDEAQGMESSTAASFSKSTRREGGRGQLVRQFTAL